RIARVARLKLRLTAEIRHPKAVPVRSHSANYAVHDRMVPMNVRLRILCGDSRPRLSGGAKLRCFDRPKPQRIHHGDGPRAHGENIAQNPAHSCGRPLKGLDKRWMIMRLNLERARPAVPNIDDPRVLSRPLHHPPA